MRVSRVTVVGLQVVAGTMAVAAAQERPRRPGRADVVDLEKER
jgi:hypothetical protein